MGLAVGKQAIVPGHSDQGDLTPKQETKGRTNAKIKVGPLRLEESHSAGGNYAPIGALADARCHLDCV